VAGTVERLPLGPLAALSSSDLIRAGVLSAEIDVRGTADSPTGRVRVGVDGLAGPRFPATDGRLEVTLADQTRAVVRVSRGGRPLAAVDASLGLPVARFQSTTALAAAPLSVKGHVGPLRLQRVDLPAITPRAKARILTAALDADLHVSGSLGAPRLALLVGADDVRFGDQGLGHGKLTVRYAASKPELLVELDSSNGGSLRLAGSAVADLSYPRGIRALDVKAIPLTVDLQSRDLDLTALSGLAEPVREVGGRLTATARVRGRVAAPTVDGRLEWQDGKLVLTGSGAYDRIHLLVQGNGEKVTLQDLSAHAGTGQVKLWAQALKNGQGYKVTSNVDLKSFPVYTSGQPAATITLRAGVGGAVSTQRVDVNTQIHEMHMAMAPARPKRLQPLSRPADIVVVNNGRPVDHTEAKKMKRLQARLATETELDGAAAPSKPPTPIRVSLDAPRNLWVEGPDVHLELGLEPNFYVVVTDEPRVFGTVTVKRGRVEALGKRFDLDPSSTVHFTGPIDAPELAVKATHEARRAEIKIQVSVDGPATGPHLKLESPDNPQLGDTELLTVLATGHLPEERASTSATPANRATSLLGGLVAGQLQKTLSRRLPLDVLTIEPGQGLSGTRLEAGTYLTDQIYAAYVGRIGADPYQQNRNEIQLEYQLTRRWSFQGTYGDSRIGSADLVWTKRY
jgi:translocation and assembly module TamB